MFYQTVEDNNNTRYGIDTWYGYNHSLKPSPGEFYDMLNLTTDGFPVATVRPIRDRLIEAEHQIRGMLYTGSWLAYLDGYIFHYHDWSIDLYNVEKGIEYEIDEDATHTAADPETWTEQQLVEFGAYVLIYPMNVWVNLNTHTAGMMDAIYKMAQGETVSFTMTDKEGNAYQNVTVSDEAPSNPTTGSYWLCTLEEARGLNVYYSGSWSPVATTYIRIDVPGAQLDTMYSEGDVINMNANVFTDVNVGSIIQKVAAEYIIVIGIMDEPLEETCSELWRFTITRKIPRFDYVCVADNRVWGCRYSYDGSSREIINEIACTKLGDFKNWECYEGLASDSYAVSIGVGGNWTGCITYQGKPLFFKENMLFRVYGSMPSEYSLVQKECRGVQEGSSKSLAIVGEYVYYKAPSGVMVYDGSLPTFISEKFGRDEYYFDGIAGVCDTKYYLQCNNTKMAQSMFVYDTQYGIWTRESSLNANQFAYSTDGRLFACTRDNIYGLGHTDHELYTTKLVSDEEYVKWMATTGDFEFGVADFKYMSRLTLRAYLPHASEIKVEISYDDKAFEQVGILRGLDNTYTQTLAIYPFRCDHFRLRFSGHGDARIYNLTMTYDLGSEEHANTY